MGNQEQEFTGKVAVVTGGASGIGFSIVDRLIKEGAKVAAGDINVERLEELKSEFGDQFLGVKVDVTKEEDIEALVSQAVEAFGRVDYGFNVAGAQKMAPIADMPVEDWDFTVDLCLKGVFLSMKHQARQMKKQGGGAIVNVASLNSHVPMYAGSAYASAKAGVEMLTKNGALELARENIRVNAILPGLVDSPLTASLLEQDDINKAYMERIPMERPAKPDEIAGPAIFLVSKDAGYISGSSLLVDGAWATSGYPDMSRFM
ncbi:SDR family NAD(P)-dependent oxidoreductase [Alkalihalobacillus sp. FSL W8-0930]